MSPIPSRAAMSTSAEAVSSACIRLSSTQGPAIRASGNELLNRTRPTVTMELSAASTLNGPILAAGTCFATPARSTPNERPDGGLRSSSAFED